MKQRISPDRLDMGPVHEEAMYWVNALVLDLKLQLLGQPPNKPIDMTRLDEWRKHQNDLEHCKERRKFY
jgi:hypothetical protein